MTTSVPPRNEIPKEYTWNIESVFPSDEAWDTELHAVGEHLPSLAAFQGHLSDSPQALADWLEASEKAVQRVALVLTYASMRHNVNTSDQAAKAHNDRGMSLLAQFQAVTAFSDPEIIGIGFDTLRVWTKSEPRLAVYEHYFDELQRRRGHVRSAEVEEVLGLASDPFRAASATHAILTDTDLVFAPARTSGGEEISLAQGNYELMETHPDRNVRRSAWESYSDAHLALRNTMANCLSAAVKQHVFSARVRRYDSALQAALEPNHIPIEVFHNLIETYHHNLPIWHRYWAIRRRALNYDRLHAYDIKAPLTRRAPSLTYEEAVSWIVDGMRPLGGEYVDALRKGTLEDRWVDVLPNQHKTNGAYSDGFKGTHPFILMSFTNDIYSMSTLAHELGHSLHSYFTWQTQPLVYSDYGLFVAEVASNFNQAMVRAHLMQTHDDPDFQIAVIEEAMSNFHRYFFIMPALARFELEIHGRIERGQALTAQSMIDLMADLFSEGYGGEVEVDRDRVGITWGEFSSHLYANFYVYQYATGISAANALAQSVLAEGEPAAERYLSFLRSGGSLYPLDALKLAGVDMTTPEPVEKTFGVLSDLVDRLAYLIDQRAATPA